MIKYYFSISNFNYVSIEDLIRVLPDHFSVSQENDNTFLIVFELEDNQDELQAKSIIDRELVRLFYLTGLRCISSLRLVEFPNGQKRSRVDIAFMIEGVKKIPENIVPQQWSNDIIIQLKLWRLAHINDIPLAAKINLLFQIVEIEYPDTGDYPYYSDSIMEPDNRTETKLLRHLVSHGNRPVGNKQLITYCRFLGISPEMHDPTNIQFINAINNRVHILTDLAGSIIENKITKNV